MNRQKQMDLAYKALIKMSRPPTHLKKCANVRYSEKVFANGNSLWVCDTFLICRIVERGGMLEELTATAGGEDCVVYTKSNGTYDFEAIHERNPATKTLEECLRSYQKRDKPTKRQTFDSVELKRVFDLMSRIGCNPRIEELNGCLILEGRTLEPNEVLVTVCLAAQR